MSQFDSGSTALRRKSSGPTVYTALLLVAAIALGAACGYVWVANKQLTGNANPVHVLESGG